MATPALEARDVSRTFGGIQALNKVGFTIDTGSISAVIGPNGAGKTTLFNVVSGFMPATAGEVLIAGEKVSGLKPHEMCKRGLVRTFQLVQLFKELTTIENVKVGAHSNTKGSVLSGILRLPWMRLQERQIEQECAAILEFVGLADQAEQKAGVLTYGQQRLLEIARALAARPKILLLDEPAAGLNKQETALLSTASRKIRDSGVTVVLIEHDMNLIMNLAEKIVVLDLGEKIAEGTPQEIRQNPRVIQSYLGGVG